MRKNLFLAATILSAGLATAAFAQSNMGSSNSNNGAPAAATPDTSPASPSGQTTTRHHARTHHVARSNGMRGAQQALQSQGLYQGKIDGKYGPQTKTAIAQFQQQNNLKQTGRLDRATRVALRGGSAPMRSGAAATPGGSGMPPNATSANPNNNADARTAPSGSSMVPQNAGVPPKPNPGATQPAQ